MTVELLRPAVEHDPRRRTYVEWRIYSRRTKGGVERFDIVWYDEDGRQRWKVGRSLEHAREIREAFPTSKSRRMAEERADEELGRARAQARVRNRADLTDAYGYVRRAAQAADRVKSTPRVREAQAALIRAEDALAAALREGA